MGARVDHPAPPTTARISDEGIPALVRRLGDDSRRLGAHEVRLAKLELGETLATLTHGAMWVGVGVGIAVVSAVALTIFLSVLIGRLAGAHYWLGATSVGAIEILVGAWCVQRGIRAYRETDFSFSRSREALRETVARGHAIRGD